MDLMAIRRMLMSMGGDNLKLIGTYTVQESWESDSKGNGKYIWENVVLPFAANEPVTTVLIVVTEGNTASNYALRKIVNFAGPYSIVSGSGAILRQSSTSSYSIRSVAELTSAWCSNGTIIKVYKVE